MLSVVFLRLCGGSMAYWLIMYYHIKLIACKAPNFCYIDTYSCTLSLKTCKNDIITVKQSVNIDANILHSNNYNGSFGIKICENIHY